MKDEVLFKQEEKEFYGECEEIMKTHTGLVKSDTDKMDHSVVCIQIGGHYTNEDGEIRAYLVPDDAVAFAKEIIAKAEKANKENFFLLKYGAPF